jgi:adenylate cyclase
MTNSAIMFVDICGSMRLYADYGDDYAMTLTSRCIQGMQSVVTHNDGEMVEIRGDGILCTFIDVDTAFKTAQCIIQNQSHRSVAVHGGIHWGPMISQHDSIFGDTVNVGARVANLAKDEEIILSEDAWQQLSADHRALTRKLGKVQLKGKLQPLTIYLALFSQLDQTTQRIPTLSVTPSASLELSYMDRMVTLNEPAPDLVMGRHISCDLIVQHSFASRKHATIIGKLGKFFLLDHSSNGSYIVEADQQTVFICRDMVQLKESGFISLGIEPNMNPEHVIRFRNTDVESVALQNECVY